MAWDSSATMQMTSQYQGMYAQQMGFSQQLSSYGQSSPYGGNTLQANNMMLGGMRGVGHAANIGMAAAGVGAGLGVAAMGGGLMASTGVGIPIMAAGAAMGYAGSQMYKGAEQQGVLNQQLRQSFGFRNQQGGHGFSGSDMTQIGGSIREMSNQVGAGGEMTSFRELGNIASKMGQMGFAQGVKDVATFSKKFKEMTDSLKTMAKDLGTTMEGAMEFAQAAKGSGVFGMSNAAKFGSIARSTAVSGGLAMSEVTAMAGIGSQISRSVGGLGKAGAMAGMKTIGQIGTATQMGVLSEEDIYNTTGLTGAEGRQAYAASSLQKTATFLSSGRGRRTLASMAGKDGKLDMNAVDSLMSGNMGTTETMASAQSHLGEVGRANFIRNEGRLRGEAMSKIGGFLPGIQMMQWAKSKGVDINNMDDRSMLFAQRQLGMGRDEVDQAIKMAQEMPRIVAQQNADASSDKLAQRVAEKRKTQGLEGVKNRFAQAEHAIDSKLEKVGQDMFNEGSNKIEAFMNRLAGEYVKAQTADMAKLERDISRGGSLEASARKTTLGQGSGGMGSGPKTAPGAGGFAAFSKGSGTMAESVTAEGGIARFLLQGESQMSKLKKEGYDLSDIKKLPKDQRDAAFGKAISDIEAINKGADTPNEIAMRASVGTGGSWLSDAYGSGRIKGKGKAEMDSFAAELEKAAKDPNNPGAKAVKAQWDAAGTDKAKQASIIQSAKTAQEISTGGLKANVDFAETIDKGFHSEAERDEALGKALGSSKGPSKLTKGIGHGIANLVPFGGMLFGDTVTDMISGGAGAKRNSQGKLIGSQAYKDAATGAFTGGKEGLSAIDKIINDKGTSDSDREQYRELKGLAQYDALKQGGKASDKELEAKAKELGMSRKDVEEKIGKTVALVQEGNRANEKARVDYLKQSGKDNMERMQSRGLVGSDGNLRQMTEKETNKLGNVGLAYLDAMVRVEQAHKDGIDTPGQGDREKEAFGKMSASQLKAFASHAAGSAAGANAGQVASISERLNKGAAHGMGAGANIGRSLGLKMTKDEMQSLKGMSADEMTTSLSGKLGVGGTSKEDKFAQENIREAAKLLAKPGATQEDRQKAAAALQKAKSVSDDHKSEDEKKKKDAADKDSPMYQVLNDIKESMKRSEPFIKDTAASTRGTLLNTDPTKKPEGASK